MKEWIESRKNLELNNAKFVIVIAEIKNNETGEIREYETEEILSHDDEHPPVFNWEENNYACDCNRRLFFKRVKNEETEDDWNVPCSDGKYSVNLKNKFDGSVYYREFEN